MNNRERAERRREAVAYKHRAKLLRMWYSNKRLRDIERKANLASNRDVSVAFPF